MVDYYFPPLPGKVGSDPRDWWDQKMPANWQEAAQQVEKTSTGRLIDSVSGQVIMTASRALKNEPTTIHITEGAGFTKEWIWPIVIGVGFLLVYFSRGQPE